MSNPIYTTVILKCNNKERVEIMYKILKWATVGDGPALSNLTEKIHGDIKIPDAGFIKLDGINIKDDSVVINVASDGVASAVIPLELMRQKYFPDAWLLYYSDGNGDYYTNDSDYSLKFHVWQDEEIEGVGWIEDHVKNIECVSREELFDIFDVGSLTALDDFEGLGVDGWVYYPADEMMEDHNVSYVA